MFQCLNKSSILDRNCEITFTHACKHFNYSNVKYQVVYNNSINNRSKILKHIAKIQLKVFVPKTAKE